MVRRSIWQIDMGDGSFAVCCMACRLALYRGGKAGADRVFAGHRCEPVVPSAVGGVVGRPDRGPTRAPVWRRDPGPAMDGCAAHRQPPAFQ
jgi:hypothetical protein